MKRPDRVTMTKTYEPAPDRAPFNFQGTIAELWREACAFSSPAFYARRLRLDAPEDGWDDREPTIFENAMLVIEGAGSDEEESHLILLDTGGVSSEGTRPDDTIVTITDGVWMKCTEAYECVEAPEVVPQ